VKIAILNDTHFGVRNGSDIFADNARKFYEEVFFPYLEEHGIKNIVHLGDFYDNRKTVMVKTMARARHDFLRVLRERGIHMDIIPGNHDVVYKNTNEVNSLKELLGHYMGEVTIHMDPVVKEYDGFRLALVPWINSENYDHCLKFIGACKADWLGGHLELKGFEVLKGVESHDGMDYELFSRFEQVLTGHFHTKSNKDNIRYLGSQLEFTWSDAHDPKHFHILDTNSRELIPVLNPHTMFERIYYDADMDPLGNYEFDRCDNKFVKVVVINKGDLFTFDRFIDRIQEQAIHDLNVKDNFEEFTGSQVSDEGIKLEETETLLDTYIENVETVLDKLRLKQEIRALHIEAQSMDIT